MNRPMIQAILCLTLCPLLKAQQPTQASSTPTAPLAAQTIQVTGTLRVAQNEKQPVQEPPLTAADLDRSQILKQARTIVICSETEFLTAATLDRALMRQPAWDKLGLSIVSDSCYGDPRSSKPRPAELKVQINRVIFTHIHTYILTDKATGIVLASGRVRAFDGVVASGPMAEQIVKALSSARLSASPVGGDQGL
ncbi:MAG: hypothetical protein WBQ94_12740 [Terracidiphilus sp.]